MRVFKTVTISKLLFKKKKKNKLLALYLNDMPGPILFHKIGFEKKSADINSLILWRVWKKPRKNSVIIVLSRVIAYCKKYK